MIKYRYIRKTIIFILFIIPLLTYQGCKKSPKCGCGKDAIYTMEEAAVYVQYNESTNTVLFYPMVSTGSTYYFCNPGTWIDTLKTMDTDHYLLVSGEVYYECNYLYSSSNYYYQVPPVYQVDVTDIKTDNYGK